MKSNHNYNLRSRSEVRTVRIDTVFKGQNFNTYFGSGIWNSIPVELRGKNYFQVLKSEIKTKRSTNCPSRLRKIYIQKLMLILLLSWSDRSVFLSISRISHSLDSVSFELVYFVKVLSYLLFV